MWRPRSRPAQLRSFALGAEAQTGTARARQKSERSVGRHAAAARERSRVGIRNHTGPAAPAPADDGTKLTLPGADKTFTLDQIRNRMGPADWFPGDHPSMPSVVAIGREQAGIWACSLCHYPNGKGRPENAGIAGLNQRLLHPAVHDFKRRRAAERGRREAEHAGDGGLRRLR